MLAMPCVCIIKLKYTTERTILYQSSLYIGVHVCGRQEKVSPHFVDTGLRYLVLVSSCNFNCLRFHGAPL